MGTDKIKIRLTNIAILLKFKHVYNFESLN